MNVWEASDQSDDGKIRPLGGLLVEGIERDQERQGPDLQHDRSDRSAVDDLAEEAEDQECDESKHCRRNAKQVGFCRVETEVTKGQCEICLRRSDGNLKRVSDHPVIRRDVNIRMCVSPRIYRGHILQSTTTAQMFLTLSPWRLCMSDFDGSSRSTLISTR